MQVQRPLGVVSTSVSTDVLAALARADSAFTPPEIHQLIGDHSVAGVRKALRALVAQGIVDSERVGQAVRYQLNRQHLAARHIVALAGLKEELVARTTRRIASWKVPCAEAALFGSAARDEMRPDSDIDLFLVRPAAVDPDDQRWRGQVDGLERAVQGWTGNDVRTLEYGEPEVQQGLVDGDRVLADIRREGITLVG